MSFKVTFSPHFFSLSSWAMLCAQATSNNANNRLLTHPKRSTRHPEKYLNDLDFADDISLLASSLERAQLQLFLTEEAAAHVGILITTNKIKFMAINFPGNEKLTVEPETLKQVNDLRLFRLHGCQ